MPKRKIPSDAFTYYVSLGPSGSYEAVAQKYGVSKRSVTKLARKESWQDRLEELQRKARQEANEKALESLEQMNQRHIKLLHTIEGRAFQALKSLPLDNAIAAVRALDIAIRQERAIRGEPGDGSGESMEAIIRREYERWMVGGDSPANAMTPGGEDSDDSSDLTHAAQ